MLPTSPGKCTYHLPEGNRSCSHQKTVDKLLVFAVIILVTFCSTIDSRNIAQQHTKKLDNINQINEQQNEQQSQRLQSNLTNSNSYTAKSDVVLRNITPNTSTTKEAHGIRIKRRLKSPTNALPEFSAPIGNVTAVLGRDVRLVCTVENLGHYQVAWLKEETRTILSIDTNIIITNYRIFLIPDEEERKWVLHIKDVQESDRGYYQCQVNTNPMRSTVGYLEVVVPPKITEAQTTQVAEIAEHSNVSIQCKASGHPKPSITWRREDGQPIRLNGYQFEPENTSNASRTQSDSTSGSDPSPISPSTTMSSTVVNEIKSEKLSLLNVDRTLAGLYVCTANNGIPSQVSKRIPVYVKFPPKVSVKSKYISVSLGEQLDIDCIVEAFPKPTNYWSRKPAIRSDTSVAALSISHRNNNGFITEAASLPFGSTATTVPKRKQMAIYEQVTATQMDDNNGQFVTMETHPSTVWSDTPANQSNGFASSSMPNSERLTGSTSIDTENDNLDDTISEPSPMSLKQSARQYNIDYNFNDNFRRIRHNSYPPSTSETPISRHNFQRRLKLRQVVVPMMINSDLDSSLLGASTSSTSNGAFASETGATNGNINNSNNSNNLTSAYVTVKQTALNAYTYKLRLSIARVQPDDFGGYVCISSNSLGTSQEYTFVTRADRATNNNIEKVSSQTTDLSSSSSSNSETDYQGDSLLIGSARHQTNYGSQNQGQTSSPMRSRLATSGNGRVVYDENYLQAIKSRYQSGNFAATGKLQQKLRMRPDRNSGSSRRVPIQLVACLQITAIGWLYLLTFGRH